MSWRDKAACKDATDVDWFPSFDRGGGWRGNLAAARLVCDGCPVKAQCLATALEDRNTAGIWAGTTESQRRRWPGLNRRPRRTPRCGTPTGYRHHRYVGEPPCPACREANTIAARVARHQMAVVQ